MSGPESRKCLVRDVGDYITCPLCRGYLVGATTAVECMHSFCRSCIVRHIAHSFRCPVCHVKLHEARPMLGIRPDPTLQSLAYKLVPDLYQKEMRRLVRFYNERGLAIERQTFLQEGYFYSNSDGISVCLQYDDSDDSGDEEPEGVRTRSGKPRRRRSQRESMESKAEEPLRHYMLCPGAVTVGVLRKLLRSKYSAECLDQVAVWCERRPAHDHLSLVDLMYIHSWSQVSPLLLSFKVYSRAAADEPDARVAAASSSPAGKQTKRQPECSPRQPAPPPVRPSCPAALSPLPSPSLPLGSPSLPHHTPSSSAELRGAPRDDAPCPSREVRPGASLCTEVTTVVKCSGPFGGGRESRGKELTSATVDMDCAETSGNGGGFCGSASTMMAAGGIHVDDDVPASSAVVAAENTFLELNDVSKVGGSRIDEQEVDTKTQYEFKKQDDVDGQSTGSKLDEQGTKPKVDDERETGLKVVNEQELKNKIEISQNELKIVDVIHDSPADVSCRDRSSAHASMKNSSDKEASVGVQGETKLLDADDGAVKFRKQLEVEVLLHERHVDECPNARLVQCATVMEKMNCEVTREQNNPVQPGIEISPPPSQCTDNTLVIKKNNNNKTNDLESSTCVHCCHIKSICTDHKLCKKSDNENTNVLSTKADVPQAQAIKNKHKSQNKICVLDRNAESLSSNVVTSGENVLPFLSQNMKNVPNTEDVVKVAIITPGPEKHTPGNKNVKCITDTSHDLAASVSVTSSHRSETDGSHPSPSAEKDVEQVVSEKLLLKYTSASTFPFSYLHPPEFENGITETPQSKCYKSMKGAKKCGRKNETKKENVSKGSQLDCESPKALDLSLKCKRDDVLLPKPKLYLPYLLTNSKSNKNLSHPPMPLENKKVSSKLFHCLTTVNVKSPTEEEPSLKKRATDSTQSARPPSCEETAVVSHQPVPVASPFKTFFSQRTCYSPTNTFISETNAGSSHVNTSMSCYSPRRKQKKAKLTDPCNNAKKLNIPVINTKCPQDSGKRKMAPALLKVPRRKYGKHDCIDWPEEKPRSLHSQVAGSSEIPALVPASHLPFLKRSATSAECLPRADSSASRHLGISSLTSTEAGHCTNLVPPVPLTFLPQGPGRWQDLMSGCSSLAGVAVGNGSCSISGKCGDLEEMPIFSKSANKTHMRLCSRTRDTLVTEVTAPDSNEGSIKKPKHQTFIEGDFEVRLNNRDELIKKGNSSETQVDHQTHIPSVRSQTLSQTCTLPVSKKRSIENVAAVLTQKANKKTDSCTT